MKQLISTTQPSDPFSPERDDTSNLVLLEHVNLRQPDQQLATQFYVVGLQFTRDPYLMVGLDNMWINIGRTQLHLPTDLSGAQRLPGCIGLVVPDLDTLQGSLQRARTGLAHTTFAFERHADRIETTCPWGNRFCCHAPDPARWGATQLGLIYLEIDVAAGSAPAIAEFYRTMLGAPADTLRDAQGRETAVVQIGTGQQLRFVEATGSIAPYDGHHIQVYLADFSGPYRRLKERGLVTREVGAHEWRFIDIVDLATGKTLHRLEHEIRSLRHPLYGRPLVNRNAAQSNAAYTKGLDAFRGTY